MSRAELAGRVPCDPLSSLAPARGCQQRATLQLTGAAAWKDTRTESEGSSPVLGDTVRTEPAPDEYGRTGGLDITRGVAYTPTSLGAGAEPASANSFTSGSSRAGTRCWVPPQTIGVRTNLEWFKSTSRCHADATPAEHIYGLTEGPIYARLIPGNGWRVSSGPGMVCGSGVTAGRDRHLLDSLGAAAWRDDTRPQRQGSTGRRPGSGGNPPQDRAAENRAGIRQMAMEDRVSGQPSSRVRKWPAGAGPASAHSFTGAHNRRGQQSVPPGRATNDRKTIFRCHLTIQLPVLAGSTKKVAPEGAKEVKTCTGSRRRYIAGGHLSRRGGSTPPDSAR